MIGLTPKRRREVVRVATDVLSARAPSMPGDSIMAWRQHHAVSMAADADQSTKLTGGAYWQQVANAFESEEQFKGAVLKDLEVVSLVGALMMTIALSIHLTDDWIDETQPLLRRCYLASVFASIVLSLSGTILAARTIVMLNLQPGSRSAALLSRMEARRLIISFYPYNLVKIATLTLVGSPCFIVIANYETTEWIAVIGLMLAMVLYLLGEDHNHSTAALEVAEYES